MPVPERELIHVAVRREKRGRQEPKQVNDQQEKKHLQRGQKWREAGGRIFWPSAEKCFCAGDTRRREGIHGRKNISGEGKKGSKRNQYSETEEKSPGHQYSTFAVTEKKAACARSMKGKGRRLES